MKKQILAILILLLLQSFVKAQNAFITEWANTQSEVLFPTNALSGVYNYNLKWYKKGTNPNTPLGTATGLTKSFLIRHLPYSDTVVIELTGTYPQFIIGDPGMGFGEKLVAISQWGTNQWVSFESAFMGCKNLKITATDVPDLTLVTNLNNMFSGCTSLNQSIDSWNVSNVTSMQGMFSGCTSYNQHFNSWSTKTANLKFLSYMFQNATSFNQSIDGWNTNNSEHLFFMFEGATAFNQPLNQWRLAGATLLMGMFKNATSFNQPIGSWTPNNTILYSEMFSGATSFNQSINTWNTAAGSSFFSMFDGATSYNQTMASLNLSNAKVLNRMFANATAFNQPISNWNTGNVESMDEMFSGATSFNQNLGNWSIANVATMPKIFENSDMTYCNFDSTLMGWTASPKTTLANINMGGTTTTNPKYSSISAAARTILSSRSWTISSAEQVIGTSTALQIIGASRPCKGSTISLQSNNPLPAGGAYYWYKGSCKGTSLGNGTSNVLNNVVIDSLGINKFYVATIDNRGCATPCEQGQVTIATSAPTNLARNNDTASCSVSGTQYVEFVTSDRALMAINANGGNLGNVFVTSFVAGAPIGVQDCIDTVPAQNTATLQRHFVVKTTSLTGSSFTVRVYLDDSEITNLMSVANNNTNPNDNINGLSELKMTKYSGPNEDSLFPNNCGTGGDFVLVSPHPSNQGNASAILPGFSSTGKYIEYNVTSFSELWLHGSVSGSPLPIELESFEASCESSRIKINWTTSSEQNNAFFTIEKSLNGIIWEEVARINGQGNSNTLHRYEIWDNKPNATQYYRLSQQDYDGSTVSYTPISANCLNIASDWSASIFPNPMQEEGFVKIKSPVSYEANVKIFDVLGKEIYVKQISILEGEHDYPIYLNGSESMYILTVQDNINITHSLKIMKRQ